MTVGESVITLHRNRRAHLARLLEGLGRASPPPTDVVVVEMGEADDALPETPFPVNRVVMARNGLPLAAARNAGRAAARGERLIFLDVDCIPGQTLVPLMADTLARLDALICCPIRYLSAGAVRDGWREEDLLRAGLLHPARTFPESGTEKVENAGLFWSLAFGIRAETFDRIGGFDESFEGYGAEDTDFAFRAAAAGVQLLFVGGACAFHQHHASCDPPLQHFADIVANARRFRDRHGFWPMDGWLDRFAALGLIDTDRTGGITILCPPTQSEITAAALPPTRAF